MARVTLTITPFGGLAVGTVVLSNEAETIGIKRNSDSFVVVAAGEPMIADTNDEWYYETTLLDPLTDYTAYVKVEFVDEDTLVFDHYEYVTAHVAGISSEMTFRSLRRKLSTFLGGWSSFTTTDGPGANQLQSSVLIDTDAKSNLFDETWFYVCSGDNAGQQAKGKKGGFEPDAGRITLVRPLTSTTLSGVEVEYSSKLPVIKDGKVMGLREVLNQALEHLWTVDQIALPTADGIHTDLSSIEWLRRQSQVISVTYKGTTEEYEYGLNDSYYWRYDAEQPMMIGPTGTQADTIVAYRPLNTWIKRGGAWQEANGFVDDSDECLGDPILIVQVALYFAYRAIATNPFIGEAAKARYELLASQQAVIAANIKRMHSPERAQTPGVRYVWEPYAKDLIPLRRL